MQGVWLLHEALPVSNAFALDGVVTATELREAYLAVDGLVTSGQKEYAALSDAEVAGLWICQHGTPEAALKSLRMMSKSKRENLMKKWPGFKGHLEEAWRVR